MKNRSRFLNVIIAFGALFVCSVSLVYAEEGIQIKGVKNPGDKPEKFYDQKVKLLSKAELDKFLNQRFEGRIGNKFGQFSNVFLITSNIQLGTGIGLTTKDKKLPKLPLEPGFPTTYKPTVREFLDAIALELASRWRYDEEDQIMKSSSPPSEKPVENLVIFDFAPVDTPMPFSMKPAKGWKTVRRTNWIMYVPPNFPIAMDLHVLGTVTSDDKAKQAELEKSAPVDMAFDRLKLANPKATKVDLVKKKVGEYDAYYFESQLPPKGEEKFRWREWHFIVGNRLCYIISTIPKNLDKQLFPDVEQMIKTFSAREIQL